MRLIDGAVVVVQAEGRARSPNVEVFQMQKGGAILGRGAERDFPWHIPVPKAVALVVPRTSRSAAVRVECISNVIYQNVYLIRLINVSGFLSN